MFFWRVRAMPDTAVERTASGPYPGDLEARVTVLEHIARADAATFERIERRFDAIDRRFEALERRLDAIIQEHRADFCWLVGIMLAMFGTMIAGFGGMLGAMAHGFHWIP
jgi:hypothetical protein